MQLMNKRDRFPIKSAALVALVLLIVVCPLSWAAFQWRRLSQRANAAEARLVRTKRQLAQRKEELAGRKRRADELQNVESALRQELSELSQLQAGFAAGIGVSRQAVAETFADHRCVSRDVVGHHPAKYCAIESAEGSMHLWGPAGDLTRIEFFSTLTGKKADASHRMLARLLTTVVPQWDAADRTHWLEKAMRVEDGLAVYREVGDVRISWRWTEVDDVRVDTVSIEPR